MADSRPLSTASSNPVDPDTDASFVASNRPRRGQLWKRIGLIGSVAVMGGQPVLAQINLPVGDVVAPPVVTETDTAAATTEESVPVAPPTSTAPESAAPAFSDTAPDTAPAAVPQAAAASAETSETASIETDAPDVASPETASLETDTPEAASLETASSETEDELEETASIETETPETASLETEEDGLEEDVSPSDDAVVSEPETAASTVETAAHDSETVTSEEESEAKVDDVIITTEEAVTSDLDAVVLEVLARSLETPEVEVIDPSSEAADTDDGSITSEEAAPEAAAPEADVVPSPETEATEPTEIVTPSNVVPEALPTVEDLASEYGGVFVDPTEYSEGATPSLEAPEVVVSDDEQPTVAAASVPQPSIKIGPVSVSRSGVRFSGSAAPVASREFYNTVAQPVVDLQAGESFVFPLASPSPITSLFGWRWHPIHNDYRFHNGTDMGAPQGTPILATQSGRVSVADYLGGYGLTVILRHGDNTLESRYAHMSHILVQPGEWVEQGDVIGLVGSTGNSTGPHLHFELHQLTNQGWVALNPNELMRYTLANINNRVAGNPLQAFNIQINNRSTTQLTAALPKDLKTETLVGEDAPHFRPAQPHAQ